MPQILKDQIIYDSADWLGGLHPQANPTATYSQKLFNGLASEVSFDPFVRLGYAAPGSNPSTPTGQSSLTDLVRGGVVDSSGLSAICISNVRIHKVDVLNGNVTTGGGVFPHAISPTAGTSGSVVGRDIVKYYVGSTQYVFYSYGTSAEWDVGRYDLSSTFNDTYMSVTAASPLASPYVGGGKSAPHPMVVGDDDTLIIGDRNFVHGFDGQTGANGTFVAARLILPKGYVVTSFAKLPDALAIFAYREVSGVAGALGEVTVFFWDYYSSDPYKKYKINANTVTEAFEYQSTIGCFVTAVADHNLSKGTNLLLWDGSRFIIKASTSLSAPTRGGVQVINDMIYANCGGTVFAYGTPHESIPPAIHRMMAGTGTTSGMLRSFFSDVFLVSTDASSAGKLEAFTSGTYSTGSFITNHADLIASQSVIGTVTAVRIEFGTTASGGRGFTLTLQNRSSASVGEVCSALTTVSTGDLVHHFTMPTSGGWGNFDSLKLKGEWVTGSGSSSAPLISRIIVYYKPNSVTKKS